MEQHGDKNHLKVQKWFYFVVIATTTIGFGDVAPRTQAARIFYACFSIPGIILMMSLLKSCGKIITSIQMRSYRLLRRHHNARLSEVGYFVRQLISLRHLIAFFIANLIDL